MDTLMPSHLYHIYNRANGNEKIFKHEKNYHFFLKKYALYLSPVINTYCYCLIPNHFHLLVEIKDEAEIQDYHSKKVSHQFSKFFSSYTQSFNKAYNRKGSLFMKNFKRKMVNDEKYLVNLIHYIHLNPINHGLCKSLDQWKFSSFMAMISDGPTALCRTQVLELFDGRKNFINCHLQQSGFGVDDL